MEIGAIAIERQGPPFAHEVGFPAAHEYRPGETDQEGGTRAVIATVGDCRLYIGLGSPSAMVF